MHLGDFFCPDKVMIPDSRPTSNGGLSQRYEPHPTVALRVHVRGTPDRDDVRERSNTTPLTADL